MNKQKPFQLLRLRPLIFALAAAAHILVIVFAAFNVPPSAAEPEESAAVMKLVDVREEIPPPEKIPDTPFTNTQDAVAETIIESETVTPPVLAVQTPPVKTRAPETPEYLPQHKITVLPVLPEAEIIGATVYPPIARRSNIEGIVYLELFIDRQGNIRDVRILRENPAGRGFGAAAVNAFRGIRGKPAEANGETVAVRYRYNINFRLN